MLQLEDLCYPLVETRAIYTDNSMIRKEWIDDKAVTHSCSDGFGRYLKVAQYGCIAYKSEVWHFLKDKHGKEIVCHTSEEG